MAPELRFLFCLFMTLGLGCWALANIAAGVLNRRARRQQRLCECQMESELEMNRRLPG